MSPGEERKIWLEELRKALNNSPYYRHIGMELAEFNDAGCVMRMKVGDEHMNLLQIAHGGSVASIADSACGLSLLIALNEGEYSVTQSLVVNYLRPVRKGTLTARGWIVHRGTTSAVTGADVFNEAGEKVAHAQSTNAIRKGPLA